MYTCDFCSFSSENLNDFEPDEQFHKGFWCPYCDGFTYFPEQSHKHRFTLLLEDSFTDSAYVCSHSYPKPAFKTQISPLRYPGGKSKFVGPILSKCNSENMINYAEPFAGGASVGLSLLLAGRIENLYLNDVDFGIYSLFFTIKYFPQILIQKIQDFIPSKDAFQKAKTNVLNGLSGLDTTEAAWDMLIANRLAFSGIVKANCMSNPAARWNPTTLINRIKKIHAYAEHLFVSNIDACSFIEEMYWHKNTTLFIDPPYYEKGESLYAMYYTQEDHLRLSMLLNDLYKGMPGADMIVTYDYCKEIEELYDYPSVEVINRKYCIAN